MGLCGMPEIAKKMCVVGPRTPFAYYLATLTRATVSPVGGPANREKLRYSVSADAARRITVDGNNQPP